MHKTVSFYITSKEKNYQEIADAIRGHWFIENKLHYTKDVIMFEDTQCTKNQNAASNLALLRDVAFNLLKKVGKSIKYSTEFIASDIRRACKMIL